MPLTRRRLLLGAAALFAAPAIVRASSLMPARLPKVTAIHPHTHAGVTIMAGQYQFASVAEWIEHLVGPLEADEVLRFEGNVPDALVLAGRREGFNIITSDDASIS
jgi:hypothetical protein